MTKLSTKQLRNLIETLREGGVQSFEYEDGETRVRLDFGGGSFQTGAPAAPATGAGAVSTAALVAAPPVAAPVATAPVGEFVTSPFVGTFYVSASPESEAFAPAGRKVSRGQTLCIVEAMKLMNEIEAEYDCTVLEVLVPNGSTVQFGDKLFRVQRGA